MSEEDPLRVIREKIDKVDLQIMSFVSERAKLAKDVAAIKKRLGDKNSTDQSVNRRSSEKSWTSMMVQ